MKTPEAKVKDEVEKILKRYNAWYFKPVSCGYGRVGVPDFIACVAGKFLAIECKAGKGKLTDNQVHQIEEIKRAKGIAEIVREIDLGWLEQLLAGMK